MRQNDSLVPRLARCCGNCDAFVANGAKHRVQNAGTTVELHVGECCAEPPKGVPLMVQQSVVMQANQQAQPVLAGAWPLVHHARWCREWVHNPNVGVQMMENPNGMAQQHQEGGQRGDGPQQANNPAAARPKLIIST